jgi:hypothetical protein
MGELEKQHLQRIERGDDAAEVDREAAQAALIGVATFFQDYGIEAKPLVRLLSDLAAVSFGSSPSRMLAPAVTRHRRPDAPAIEAIKGRLGAIMEFRQRAGLTRKAAGEWVVRHVPSKMKRSTRLGQAGDGGYLAVKMGRSVRNNPRKRPRGICAYAHPVGGAKTNRAAIEEAHRSSRAVASGLRIYLSPLLSLRAKPENFHIPMDMEISMSAQLNQNLVAVEAMAVARLRPYPRNARTHSKKQIRQIADSIQRFGFTNPVLISDDDEIIAGHGRVEAAKLLGMQSVPTLRLSHLDAAQRRAYLLADNKLALNAGWDHEVLAIELQALVDLDFGVEITGFSLAEVDLVLDEARESSAHAQDTPEDQMPPLIDGGKAVTRREDLWLLDRHRVLCGDSRNRETFDHLLQSKRADLVFTDPPYNVAIDGNVCGLGRIRHREFAMGCASRRSYPSVTVV